MAGQSRTAQPTRRDVLSFAAGAAGLATLPGHGLAGVAPRSLPGTNGPLGWQDVAGLFSFRSGIVPMNAANLCPAFDPVADTVFTLTRDLNRDVSFNHRRMFADTLETTRDAIAAQLHVASEDIALVRNTSEANSIINNGFPLGEGDQVLLWTENHATNNRAWDIRQRRYGFEVKRVTLPWRLPPSTEAVVEFFREQIDPGRTRLMTFTHASNVSGLKLPAQALCEMAHEHGIYVHVDGAQSWGAMDLDLTAMGCDSFSASAHKWYCGPKETGILYVRREHAARIWPHTFGYDGEGKMNPDLPNARRFETLGQRDDSAIAALGVAAQYHEAIGPRAIHERVVALATHLKQGLRERGLTLVTPPGPEFSHGVVVVEVPGERRAALFTALYERHGIAAAPTGGLRLCPHIYNTETQVDRAVAAVADLMIG